MLARSGGTTARPAMRLALPRLARPAAALARQLAIRRAPLTLAWGADAELILAPGARPAPIEGGQWLSFSLDGRPGHLQLENAAWRRWAGLLEPDLWLAVGDPELWPLLLESSLAGLLAPLETALGARLELAGFSRTPPDLAGCLPLAFTLAEPTAPPDPALLYLAQRDAERLAAWWQTRPLAAAAALDGVMVEVAHRLGAVVLSLAELRALGAGDVILLDQPRDPRGELAAVLAERWLWPTRLARPGLTAGKPLRPASLQERERWTMAEEPAGESPQPDAASALDELPIKLVFELGRQEIGLAELRQIGPGYVFGLARDDTAPVDILAGGRRIGRGEIVRIEDEVGVRVVRLFEHG